MYTIKAVSVRSKIALRAVGESPYMQLSCSPQLVVTAVRVKLRVWVSITPSPASPLTFDLDVEELAANETSRQSTVQLVGRRRTSSGLFQFKIEIGIAPTF